MFTGIVEESGTVKEIRKIGQGVRLGIRAELCASDAKIGDSISVNGACLTIASIRGSIIEFDLSNETLNRTALFDIKSEDRVNMERSLRADARLGGHFVSGHIDCPGKIISKEVQGNFTKIEIEIPERLMVFLVEKGSIAVDGISLTINSITRNAFSILLIPHTLLATTLGSRVHGNLVNIEVDILAKYTGRLLKGGTADRKSPAYNITSDFLKEHGFS